MRKFLFGMTVIFTLGIVTNFAIADVTWEPDVRLTNDPADSVVSSDRSVAADSQNRIHTTWEDTRDGSNGEIYYKRSLDGGKTWESDERLTIDPAKSIDPSIATDFQDGVHIVWSDLRNGNYGSYEIFYKRSLDGGANWEIDRRLTINSSSSMNPSIATDSQRGVHIVWREFLEGSYKLYYKRSLDGGQTWESDRQLPVDSSSTSNPSIATDSRNRIHIIWYDYRDGNWEIYYKRSLDRGQSWERDRRLTINSSYSSGPAIAADSKNGVHVVWADDDVGTDPRIYYKRSLDGGTTWESEFPLSVDGAYAKDPSVVTDSQRRVHVAWVVGEEYGGPEGGIYYNRSSDRGRTWEGERRLTADDSDSSRPTVAADVLNRLHVVWEDERDGNSEIYYKRGTQETRWKVFGPVHR